MKNKIEILRSNLDYLIKTSNENKVSLSDGAGVNRTTLYKILEGKVDRVQEATLKKFADFFGVSFTEIQTVDLREKALTDNQMSLDGNRNPIAIPIINDTAILSTLDSRVGKLIVTFPVTYYFGQGVNIIGVFLTKNINGFYDKGDLIIIKRQEVVQGSDILIIKGGSELRIVSKDKPVPDNSQIIGSVLEERYAGKS